MNRDNEVTLFFVEIEMDGIWTAIGAGWPSADQASWSLARWRAASHCHLDHLFRIRPHTLAAPPPDDLDDEVVEIGAEPPRFAIVRED